MRARMPSSFRTLARLLALSLAVLPAAGCGDDAPEPKPAGGTKVPPAERTWSKDDMVSDPEGYLAWADAQLATQTKKRQEFLVKLAGRRTEVKERQQKAGADITELE